MWRHSYQIEGTKVKDSCLSSFWDAFAKKQGAVDDGCDGSVACEHVAVYKKDVALMKDLGLNTYRFSISWTRIMPIEGKISNEGLNFCYNPLKNYKQKIFRRVTIYHWDMPQWFYEKNNGWCCRDTAYFFYYVKLVCDLFDEYVEN